MIDRVGAGALLAVYPDSLYNQWNYKFQAKEGPPTYLLTYLGKETRQELHAKAFFGW